MTAQTILASNKPISIVLEVRTDNTKVMPAAYSDWVGGNSLLALPLGVEFEDNSLVYLSTGAVAGLTYNEVVFGDFFVERSLAAPFTGGGGLSTNGLPNAPSFAGLDIFVSGDDLELYARDWENKPFTLYVGYEGDDWANFEVYITGKTIGQSLINDGIQVDLSINPTGTDRLFPVNRFDDGRVKPYVFGSVNKIKPVKVDASSTDGLYQFHAGTPTWGLPSLNAPPYIHVDFEDTLHHGDFVYTVVDGGVTYENSASDAMPTDLTQGDGSIVVANSAVTMTLPDNTTSGDLCAFFGSVDVGTGYSFKYKIEIDISLAPESTVDSHDVVLTATFDSLGSSRPASKTTVTKAIRTVKLNNNKPIGNSIMRFLVSGEKSSSLSAEDVVVQIHAVRVVADHAMTDGSNFYTAITRVYLPDGKRIKALRVADVTTLSRLPSYVALFDNAGFVRVADELTDFHMDARGDATNDDLVASCQHISTQANGTDSPVTSSITSPDVGIYCDKAKPVFRWLQDLCDPLDIYLDVSQTTSTIDLKRRFNGTVFDADGTLNVTDAFSFTEDDIANLKQLPNEPSISKYEVSYRYRYTSPSDSPTVTNLNPFARLNQVKRIDTPLVSSADATVVAELNNRDGNRRTFYEFEIPGAGHGLSPNDTGKISHSRIKDGGLFTIRFVREYPLQKKTLIKGVKHG